MPQVHTYIRNEDMDKWKALENKSLFIHNALNGLGDLDLKPVGKTGFAKVTDDPATFNEAEEEEELSCEEQGYKVDPATGYIYDTNTDPPERVTGKVGKDGKILFVD